MSQWLYGTVRTATSEPAVEGPFDLIGLGDALARAESRGRMPTGTLATDNERINNRSFLVLSPGLRLALFEQMRLAQAHHLIWLSNGPSATGSDGGSMDGSMLPPAHLPYTVVLGTDLPYTCRTLSYIGPPTAITCRTLSYIGPPTAVSLRTLLYLWTTDSCNPPYTVGLPERPPTAVALRTPLACTSVYDIGAVMDIYASYGHRHRPTDG